MSKQIGWVNVKTRTFIELGALAATTDNQAKLDAKEILPVAEYDEQEKNCAEWRRLALQFDDHRMRAIAHLRMLLKAPNAHAPIAERFLEEGPLSREQVLEMRLVKLQGQSANVRILGVDRWDSESLEAQFHKRITFLTRKEQGYVMGMFREVMAMLPESSPGDGTAAVIHYPQHWDTAAYPTLESALSEVYAYFKCSECTPDEVVALLIEIDAAMEAAWKSRDLPACVFSGDLVRRMKAIIKPATNKGEENG